MEGPTEPASKISLHGETKRQEEHYLRQGDHKPARKRAPQAWANSSDRRPPRNPRALGEWLERRLLYFFSTVLYSYLSGEGDETFGRTLFGCCARLLSQDAPEVSRVASMLDEVLQDSASSREAGARGTLVIQQAFQERGWTFALESNTANHQQRFVEEETKDAVSAVFFLRGETSQVREALELPPQENPTSSWFLRFSDGREALSFLLALCESERSV